MEAGCEERSPEPKPRWNPKPEQIRILEAIFNSGMVNPPRDEIRKIRAQLQEYGQVGDANVFYWFQNRKSRSKHKLRHLQNSKNLQNQNHESPPHNLVSQSQLPQMTPPHSSSSSNSSEKSSPKELIPSKVFSLGFSNVSDVGSNSPTASVNNQTYFHSHNDTTLLPPPQVAAPPAETFFFPVQGVIPNNNNNNNVSSQGFCFSELSNVFHAQSHGQQNVGHCTSLLLGEIMNHGNASSASAASSKKVIDQDKSVKIMHQIPQFNFCFAPTATTTTIVPPTPTTTTTMTTVPSPILSQLQGNYIFIINSFT